MTDTGKPQRRIPVEFTIDGQSFLTLPGDDGIELSRWSWPRRRWEAIGVYATRAAARGFARRLMQQPGGHQ